MEWWLFYSGMSDVLRLPSTDLATQAAFAAAHPHDTAFIISIVNATRYPRSSKSYEPSKSLFGSPWPIEATEPVLSGQ